MKKLDQLLIKDIYGIDEVPPIVVTKEDEFAKVINLFADSSELRGIFVTDLDGQFVGVITRSDLLDWTRVQVGDIFEDSARRPDKTLRLSKIIYATTVGELMSPNSVIAAVGLEQKVKDAMRLMIELDIIVLPVIDEDNHIIGDIKISEILAASLDDNYLMK